MQPCELRHEVAGFFRLEKFKTDTDGKEIEGSREIAADWFPNLILNQGLNMMATGNGYLNACQIGSGSSAPAVGQTGLVSLISGTTTRPVNTTTAASEAPYYVAQTITYRFAEGAATGNIAEVGVGTAVSGTNLFSRSLVKDSSGNPTTITILSDESLDVIYQLRYYAPDSDVTGTIVATGNIGGSYVYTIRASSVQTVGTGFGWSLPTAQSASGSASGYLAYSGGIGGVTSYPSGSSSSISPPTAASYTNGTFFLDRIITAAATQANALGGVKSFYLKLGIGTYQIEFTPAIPKTSNDVIQQIGRAHV